MSERKVIAKITDSFLGYEDHGMFTAWVEFDYGGSRQAAGLYELDAYRPKLKKRVGTKEGMEFVIRLMRACGASEWSKLIGKTVFAVRESEQYGAKVIGIEPLPTEGGEPFTFTDIFEEGYGYE